MPSSTRSQFLDVAEALFAERGFYGVSIAAIADELGLTKQALLHHFKSKPKLYAEVLKRISDRFAAMDILVSTPDLDARGQLVSYMTGLCQATRERPQQTQLLMRELLDNQRRAETAETWYLKPFLQSLIDRLKAVPGWQSISDEAALAHIYQWLGAINYYGISGPTLTGIFGASRYADYDAAFATALEGQICAVLDSRTS